MSEPAPLDLDIYQGDDFELRLVMEDDAGPIDIALRSYRAQVREKPSDEDFLLELTPTLERSEGSLVTDTLVLKASAAETSLLPTAPAPLMWDCEETADDLVATIFAGAVNVTPEITR